MKVLMLKKISLSVSYFKKFGDKTIIILYHTSPLASRGAQGMSENSIKPSQDIFEFP